jgi:aerobic carbon-monoxide dehydrogenase medium subunit
MGSSEISDFQYFVPSSILDLTKLFSGLPRNANVKFLAGGMSLLPTLKLGLVSPSIMIDLNRMKELKQITLKKSYLSIGAMTRYSDVLESKQVGKLFPEIHDCVSEIGDMQVRNRGTVGGAVAHADPSGDLSSCMISLGAKLTVRGANGVSRQLDISKFFQGPFTTLLGSRDLLTEIQIPIDTKHVHGGAYVKLERTAGDFATVGVAVSIWRDRSKPGKIIGAGIGLTSAGDHTTKASKAEKLLSSSLPTANLLDQVADSIVEATDPSSDVRGDKEYKKDMFRVISRRTINLAIERAGMKVSN